MINFNKSVMKNGGSNSSKLIKRGKKEKGIIYLFFNFAAGAERKAVLFRENRWVFGRNNKGHFQSL